MSRALLLAFAGLALPTLGLGQGGSKAAACFWSADFEDGAWPTGWVTNPVERQTPDGAGLGETVPAFTLGTAMDANANGFFPVADLPIGNRFAMANDDAPPCNCAMSNAALTTAPIDLTGRAGVALEGRAFHEMTLGAGEARIEASTDGTTFWPLLTLPPATGQWQRFFVDLSDYDGQDALWLRFRWSDGGGWSSGFAVDDLCLRERLAHDLSVVAVSPGDALASAFDPSTRSLGYSRLPLEQAGTSSVTSQVLNRGTQALTGVSVSCEAFLNGISLGAAQASDAVELAPGEQMTFVVHGIPAPPGVGELVLRCTASAQQADEDATDNTLDAAARITGPGWDAGYSAMGCDGGIPQGVISRTDNFIAAVRLELSEPGSRAEGVSAVLDASSTEGEFVRAILFDASFAFIDTSHRHAITGEDLSLASGNGALYLPFTSAPELPPGDYFVGLQRLAGQGPVGVALSGNVPIGGAALLEGLTFDVSWITGCPMVRLHLAPLGVGLQEPQPVITEAAIHPMPASESARVEFDLASSALVGWTLLDIAGRIVLQGAPVPLSAGHQQLLLDLGSVAPGPHALRLTMGDRTMRLPLVVAR